MFVSRKVGMKYRFMAEAGEGGDAGGGGGLTAIAAALAATAASDKAAADKAVADKAAADQAAADLAAGKKPTGPSDTEAALLKENMKKKEQLAKAAADVAALEAKIKEFDGIDVVAIRKVLADQKAAEDKSLEAKGDFDRLRTRMAEEHSKEIKTLQDSLNAALGQNTKLNGTINDLSVGTQFGQSRFIADELTLPPSKARLIYSDYFDVEEGKVVGYDKPRGSDKRTALVDQYGAPVLFDAALRKIVEADPEKDHLMKSKIKPGAGSDSKKGTPVERADPTANGVSKISAGLAGIVRG